MTEELIYCPNCKKRVLPIENHVGDHYELICPFCEEMINED